MTGPTQCTGFGVRTLLGHVVGGTLRIAVVGEGGDGLAVHPFAEGVAEGDGTAAHDESAPGFCGARESDERLTAPARVPWGEVPGHAALSGYVRELVTHTRDIGEALGGRPLELGPGLAGFTLATARRVLPDPRRDTQGHFGSAVPAPEGAGTCRQPAARPGREPLSRA